MCEEELSHHQISSHTEAPPDQWVWKKCDADVCIEDNVKLTASPVRQKSLKLPLDFRLLHGTYHTHDNGTFQWYVIGASRTPRHTFRWSRSPLWPSMELDDPKTCSTRLGQPLYRSCDQSVHLVTLIKSLEGFFFQVTELRDGFLNLPLTYMSTDTFDMNALQLFLEFLSFKC